MKPINRLTKKFPSIHQICNGDINNFFLLLRKGVYQKWFDTSNYGKNDNRTLPIGKNEKVIALFKDELGGKIMIEFVRLRAKTYVHLMDNNIEHYKAKGTKKSVIKRDLMLKNYRDCLFNEKIILKSQQMINFDDYANEKKTKYNLKWPYIPDHPYRIIILGGSGSGKTNALLNLINNQPGIDKIYLHGKYPYKAKYPFLIIKRESTGLKQFNDPKTFVEYSNDMQDVYKTLKNTTQIKKVKY